MTIDCVSSGIMFIESSAKAGFNIKALFRKLANALPGMESAQTSQPATNCKRCNEHYFMMQWTLPGDAVNTTLWCNEHYLVMRWTLPRDASYTPYSTIRINILWTRQTMNPSYSIDDHLMWCPFTTKRANLIIDLQDIAIEHVSLPFSSPVTDSEVSRCSWSPHIP